MINLLPIELKTQYAFSRRNTGLRWVILAIIAVGVLSSLLMTAGGWYVGRLVKTAKSELTTKQTEITKYKSSEQKARELNSKIEAIVDVNSKTTRYSGLISDLSKLLPAGSYVETIDLNGKADAPLLLEVTANDKSTALKVHDSLADSKRFAFVDIVQFKQDPAQKGRYILSINLGFASPEAAFGSPASKPQPKTSKPTPGAKP